VRFHAGGREPSGRRTLFGVAQLDAAAPRGSFMAVAVARRGGNGLKARGHIAVQRDDWQDTEQQYSGQANTEGTVGNDGQKQRVHASCWRGGREKPIVPPVAKDHY